MILRVDTAALTLTAFGTAYRCSIGSNGAIAAAAKQEGDGATPLGTWPLRAALLRPGTGWVPPPLLPWRWLRPCDGWSDDPRDPVYNRPVTHPHAYSAENLWRDDHVYDCIVVLGFNDLKPLPNQGSAIFLHLAKPDRTPTEGCVALDRTDLVTLLPRLAPGMTLEIV